MPWAILDTDVYIGHWERGLYDEALTLVRRAFVIRHSVVVLSEFRRSLRSDNRDSQQEGLRPPCQGAPGVRSASMTRASLTTPAPLAASSFD